MSSYEAPKNTKVGHIHLKVSDLDRAISFYQDVLGFKVMQKMGDSAAFLSAGGYHHHVGLNTWQPKGGNPPSRGTTGLFHVAFLYPTMEDFGERYARVWSSQQPQEVAGMFAPDGLLSINDGEPALGHKPFPKWLRLICPIFQTLTFVATGSFLKTEPLYGIGP